MNASLLNLALRSWTSATANIAPGVQRVFKDTLTLVKDDKVHLVHGSDYRDGKPCLVNAVASMTTVGGGKNVPMENFRAVVNAFDAVNREFQDIGINDRTGYVSSLAAETLLRNFGEEKPMTIAEDFGAEVERQTAKTYSPEISDEIMAAAVVDMMKAPAPEDLNERGNEYAQQHVEYRSASVD